MATPDGRVRVEIVRYGGQRDVWYRLRRGRRVHDRLALGTVVRMLGRDLAELVPEQQV